MSEAALATSPANLGVFCRIAAGDHELRVLEEARRFIAKQPERSIERDILSGGRGGPYLQCRPSTGGHRRLGREVPKRMSSRMPKPKTMNVKIVATGACDVMLFLHTDRAPTPDEWHQVMTCASDYARRGNIRRLRGLVISDGGGPDMEMRNEIKQVYEEHDFALPTAVLTSNLVVRGLVAAISWFNPSIRVFSPNRLPAALSYLGVSSSALRPLQAAAHTLQAELPPVACLRLMDGALTEVA